MSTAEFWSLTSCNEKLGGNPDFCLTLNWLILTWITRFSMGFPHKALRKKEGLDTAFNNELGYSYLRHAHYTNVY